MYYVADSYELTQGNICQGHARGRLTFTVDAVVYGRRSRNSSECAVGTEEFDMQEQPCHETDGHDAPWMDEPCRVRLLVYLASNPFPDIRLLEPIPLTDLSTM